MQHRADDKSYGRQEIDLGVDNWSVTPASQWAESRWHYHGDDHSNESPAMEMEDSMLLRADIAAVKAAKWIWRMKRLSSSDLQFSAG
ncbi:hypothetical protein F2P81_018877 [Scophthalmus maximus]|uniref:Uncharacterized protein n=1 Tax=Scophthalmus maximus TaxID=52904 RepID=A0A6A4SHB7_SCOMX|nr:hypothetical protein F2P81_018877 [Scophthalmus maximus]